tara:strand:- start:412 stop:1065 length:654 start_codon:yes stop_codon:yes gene_type:complete
MFSVGGRYGEGKGVSQDYAKALSWLQKAKENGWTEAEGGTGLIDEMIAFLEKELPDNGVQEEIRKMSQDSTSGSILENEKVLSILKVVEKEIFENFMFQQLLGGSSGFKGTLSLDSIGRFEGDSMDALRIVFDIIPPDDYPYGEFSLNQENCEEAMEMTLDKINDEGLYEVLEEAGMEDGGNPWVHISVKGKFQFKGADVWADEDDAVSWVPSEKKA